MLDELKNRWFCSQVSGLKNCMYALAMSILKNDADAEDAIQNALLSAYEHLEDLRLFDKIKPWILTILMQVICFWFVRKKVHESIRSRA